MPRSRFCPDVASGVRCKGGLLDGEVSNVVALRVVTTRGPMYGGTFFRELGKQLIRERVAR